MVGAHLDSVREGPGINDNGSGVAVTLALAERLRDQRGLRFGFWGAEELGLYGSRRYVASLSPAERRRITGYLNLDMLGSPNAVRYLYGAGRVRDALDKALRARKLALRDDHHRRELRPRAVRRRGHLGRRAVLGLGRAQDRARGARVRRPRRAPARPLLPPALRCARPGRPRRDDRARRGRRPGAAGALRVTPEARRRRLALVVAAALALVVGVAVGAGHDDPQPRSTAPRASATPTPPPREGGAQALAPPPGRAARRHALRRLRAARLRPARRCKAGRAAGVILFKDNIASQPALTRAHRAGCSARAGGAALVATDQEGGEIRNLHVGARPPPARPPRRRRSAPAPTPAPPRATCAPRASTSTSRRSADVASGAGSVMRGRAFPGDARAGRRAHPRGGRGLPRHARRGDRQALPRPRRRDREHRRRAGQPHPHAGAAARRGPAAVPRRDRRARAARDGLARASTRRSTPTRSPRSRATCCSGCCASGSASAASSSPTRSRRRR